MKIANTSADGRMTFPLSFELMLSREPRVAMHRKKHWQQQKEREAYFQRDPYSILS